MARPSGLHEFRQLQQLRTDCKTSALGGIWIHLEANFVPLGNEVDHSTLRREALDLADGQNARVFQLAENFSDPGFFRSAHENNLALLQIFRGRNLFHRERTAFDLFSVERIERRSEWILTDDSNGNCAP